MPPPAAPVSRARRRRSPATRRGPRRSAGTARSARTGGRRRAAPADKSAPPARWRPRLPPARRAPPRVTDADREPSGELKHKQVRNTNGLRRAERWAPGGPLDIAGSRPVVRLGVVEDGCSGYLTNQPGSRRTTVPTRVPTKWAEAAAQLFR